MTAWQNQIICVAVLYTLYTCLPVLADPQQGFCVFSVSGQYGPVSRFLYYALLILPIVFHKLEWLVGATLGASMVFSSIAAVHGVALAAVRGRGTVDLDIIPVFAITGVGMLVGLPMLIWSKTLCEARRSVRSLVFVWIILMFAAVSVSTASFQALSTPIPCQSTSLLGSCSLECNVGLPFRAGQVALSIPVGWITWLFRYSILFVSCGSVLTLWLIFGKTGKTGETVSLDVLSNNDISSEFQRQHPAQSWNLFRLLPYFVGVLIISHIVIIELLLLGKHHVPFGEDFSSIGQWGPLVGAFFALSGALVKASADRTIALRGNADSPLGKRAGANLSSFV